MRPTKRNVHQFSWANLSKFVAVALLLAGCVPVISVAQQKGQKTFASAEDAANALVNATQSNEEQAMLEILGRDAKRVVASGDDEEDAQSRANFVKKYQEMHRLVTEPDMTTTLYIGAENWPTPIPLVNKANVWYFDTDAAWREILFRRVGKNEMSAIRVCQQLATAQKEYYSMQQSVYAQRIYSSDGQRDGLYWRASDQQSQSPIGPLVASAVAEGYTNTQESEIGRAHV